MKNDKYTNCTSCEEKYICPHAARGNWCGTKHGETRPDFGTQEAKDEASGQTDSEKREEVAE